MTYSVNSGLAQTINVMVYGATGNGSTDDTSAIQAALNAAASTHSVLFFPAGTYVCGPLSLTGAKACKITGVRSNYQSSGASTGTVLQWNGGITTTPHLLLTDCEDVTFEGIHLYGAQNGVDSANVGLSIQSNNSPAAYNLMFRDCMFSEHNTEVLWGNGPSNFQSDQSAFEHCHFYGFTRYGIYVNSGNAGDNSPINSCVFSGAGDGYGMYFNHCGPFTVSNCAGGGALNAFIYINSSLANNIIVQNCEAESIPYFFYITGANDASTFTFIGNTMSCPAYIGGISRVVGVGNNWTFNLTLDGSGSKYIGYGDRMLGCEVIVASGGSYINQGLINADEFDDLWNLGQITWQPGQYYSSETGIAAEQCIRTGRRSAPWQATHTYAASSYVQATVDDGHVFFTTAGGTSGGSEPSWNTSTGGSTTDGSVTWVEAGASAAFAGFAPLDHYTGTAAPISGYYREGSIVWNTTPTAGGNVGWICLATGTPGTWEAFGAPASAGGPAGGDLSGSYPNPFVASISGASGLGGTISLNVKALQQPNLVGATGTNLTIQAQGVTGPVCYGGNLILGGGFAGGSTGANPGSVIAKIAGATGPSGTYGQFQVNNAGQVSFYADNQGVLLGRSDSGQLATRIAPLVGQETTVVGLWIGSNALSPAGDNYHVAFSSSVDFFQAASQELASATVIVSTTSLSFLEPTLGTEFTITCNTVGSDLPAPPLTIQGTNAFAAGVTGVTGGNIILEPGAGATTNGTPGSIIIDLGAPSGSGTEGSLQIQRSGSTLLQFQADTGNTTYGAIYAGGVSPSTSNWSFAANGTSTYLNAVSTLNVGVGGAASPAIVITSNGLQFFSPGGGQQLGSGVGVLGLTNAGTTPTTNPSGGLVLWADPTSGQAMTRSSQGVQQSFMALGQGTIASQARQYLKYEGVVTTTDATNTTILTIPVPSGHTINGVIRVIGRAITAPTDGAIGDSWTAVIQLAIKNVSGTVTGPLATEGSGDFLPLDGRNYDTSMSTCGFTGTPSGSNFLLDVQGISGTTIDWTTVFDLDIC